MEQPEEVADLVGQHHTFGVEPRRLVLRLTPNGVNLTLCGLLRGFPRGCQSFAGSKMNRRSADPKMVCTRSTASAHAAAVTLHPRPPSLSVSGMARDRMEYASGISCPFFEDDLARSGLYSWELSLVLTMEPCQGGAWGSLSGTMTDTEFVPGGNDGLSGRGDGVRADITFGDWVRRRRRALDMTQAELADRVGYSAITVRRVEAGTRRPSKDLIEHLARGLAVPEQEMGAFRRLGRAIVGAAPDPVPTGLGAVISWARRAVPYPLGEMLGREEDEARVLTALRDGARLVTLSGPGGVGKTRLAMAVGHRCVDDFDEVCWVSLAGTSDPDLVLPAVTDAMGLGVREGQLPAATARYLTERSWLVILDTLEHLLGSVTKLTALLQAVPNLSLVVTTRTALGVPAETEVALRPLAVPDLQPGSSPQDLVSHPCVALFQAAAQRVQPDFALTGDTGPAVVSICQLVDGLPLGVEIAASNLRALSIHDLADRMLEGTWPEPQVGRSSRHRSLQTTLDASFATLSPAAQLVLTRAAVFAGEWSAEAASAICEGPEVAAECMLAVHAELRDHSMISISSHSRTTRYGMLSTMRHYAQQRLHASGAREQVEERHVAYFAGLVSQACGLLLSSHQVQCLELITEQLDDLRAALDYATEQVSRTADPGQAARLLLTTARLERFWSTTGRSAEGIRRIRRALTLPAADAPQCVPARAEALGALAVLETMQHHFDDARRAALDMRRLAEESNDHRQLCLALRNLGTIAVLHGDTLCGEHLLRQCLEMSKRTMGTAHITAWALALLGSAAFLRDDLQEAAQLYQEAMPRLRDLQDLNFLALILRRQGQMELRCKRPELAMPLIRESLQYNVALRSPSGIAACLVALAGAACTQQQFATAAQGVGRAQALLDVSGELLTRPDQEQLHHGAAAIRDRLGNRSTVELMATGSRQPLEQLWLS